MCAIPDARTTKRWQRRKAKLIRVWKIVTEDGGFLFCRHSWRPGWNIARMPKGYKTYDRHNPRGFHAFVDETAAKHRSKFYERIVPVWIRPRGIMAVECPWPGAQIVAKRVLVRRKEWEAAGVRFRRRRKP